MADGDVFERFWMLTRREMKGLLVIAEAVELVLNV